MKTIATAGLVLFIALSAISISETEITRYGDEYSNARLEPVRMQGQPGIAVIFEGTDDLHYYATSEGAPAPGLELKITADGGSSITFGPAVYPKYSYFQDEAKGKIEVFVGDFKVFIPMLSHVIDGKVTHVPVTVKIAGIACTSNLCLPPFDKMLTVEVDLAQVESWSEIDFETAPLRAESAQQLIQTANQKDQATPDTPAAEADEALVRILSGWTETGKSDDAGNKNVMWYFLLAILAGLSINIMPCVLPVIPLIIMRLVSQAKQSGTGKRAALGFSFCGGIILFFAMFAVVSVIVKLSTGADLDLNSLYRNPTAVVILFLFLVFFALVLLDILTLTLPSSVANRQSNGGGFAGSVGMGFFAGVLSTPCSGAIIGAVLVWAQTQLWYVSSVAILLMGAGMALPYAVLVSIPKLLDFVPKPGTWMEIFKKTGGFLLLALAVKFTLTALPKDYLINVLLFGVVFSFCVWMWGSWVSFSTPVGKKWTTRLIAAGIAVAAGFYLLPQIPPSQIEWQKYDPAAVQAAIEKKQPVLLKFTADWCTNCKVVEKNVYQDPEIAAFLRQQGFITIKADTTQEDYQATADYKAVFKEAGNVPNTILLNPQKQTITKIRGIFTSENLKKKITEQF